MRLLIGCEFSARVRDAFRRLGHDAWSCDILPTEGDPRYHIQDDLREVIKKPWPMLIAFPPCTHLAVSGARWFKDKSAEQEEALAFFEHLLKAPIPRIALENPISIVSTRIQKPTQIIQPYEFGHAETKKTCLWLKKLPYLLPTAIAQEPIKARVHNEPPSPDRWKNRSRTPQGIADAMASQWSY